MLDEKKEKDNLVEKEKEDIEKIISEKDKRIKELEDYSKRLKAEFENYQKRVAVEKRKIIESSNELLLFKILRVVDSFELALDCIKKNKINNVEDLKKGIEMIYKQLLSILKEEGVQKMDTVGNRFDPFEHEAVDKIENNDHKEWTILSEMQSGYKLHGNVLRPAKVVVSVKPVVEEEKQGSGESDGK